MNIKEAAKERHMVRKYSALKTVLCKSKACHRAHQNSPQGGYYGHIVLFQ